MSTKKRPIRRLRGGKPVVPVIAYMPEPLHRQVKALARKQGKSQDALINGWAERAVVGAMNGKKAHIKAKAERKIEATAKNEIAKAAKNGLPKLTEAERPF